MAVSRTIGPVWAKVNPPLKEVHRDMVRMADVHVIALHKDGATKVWRNTNNEKGLESLDAVGANGASFEFAHPNRGGKVDIMAVDAKQAPCQSLTL
jgi:hypothetical protein